MKKSQTLTEKISAYGAMAAAILAIPKQSDAQTIIYTDVNPDTLIHNGGYVLDLNGDAVPDFLLAHESNSGADYAVVKNYGSNSVINLQDTINIGIYSFNFPSPDTLISGDTINANRNWLHITSPTSTSSSSSSSSQYFILGAINTNYGISGGNWFDKGEFYMGLRFKANGNTYYGWARLVLGEGASNIVLKDYAYNSIPDSGIIAGQKWGTGIPNISEQSSNSLYVFYGENNKLNIRVLNEKMIGGNLSVMNSMGQEVMTFTVNEKEFQLNLSQLPSGIYYVRMSNNQLRQTKKVTITR